MTSPLLVAGHGPSSPSSGPDWRRVLGALLVTALLLLVSRPFHCAGPVEAPPRLAPDRHHALDANTWSSATGRDAG